MGTTAAQVQSVYRLFFGLRVRRLYLSSLSFGPFRGFSCSFLHFSLSSSSSPACDPLFHTCFPRKEVRLLRRRRRRLLFARVSRPVIHFLLPFLHSLTRHELGVGRGWQSRYLLLAGKRRAGSPAADVREWITSASAARDSHESWPSSL